MSGISTLTFFLCLAGLAILIFGLSRVSVWLEQWGRYRHSCNDREGQHTNEPPDIGAIDTRHSAIRPGERQATAPEPAVRRLFARAWLIRRKRWLPPTALTVLGVALILWSSLKLIEIFSEATAKTNSSLSIISDPACQVPGNVALILQVSAGGVRAAIHPSFSESSDAPPCIVVGADEPFRIIPNSDRGPGSADLSKMPEVQQIRKNDVQVWAAKVFFVPPPKPDANGSRRLPSNVALGVNLRSSVSHPSYTTAKLDMTVSVAPPAPNFLIILDDPLEFKDFDSIASSYKRQHKNITVSLNHGLSLFHLYMDDLSRQRLKDIFLLVAGALLTLGLGCLVDASIKFLELISERSRHRHAE